MESIVMTILVRPEPKRRPRFTRRGFAFTDKKTRSFENEIKRAATKAMDGREPIKGELSCSLSFCFKRPKKPVKTYPRPDVDNLTKAVLDALNGICYDDDSAIIQLYADKRYFEFDAIFVTVKQKLRS